MASGMYFSGSYDKARERVSRVLGFEIRKESIKHGEVKLLWERGPAHDRFEGEATREEEPQAKDM